MYPPLWTSLLVAINDDIKDTSIKDGNGRLGIDDLPWLSLELLTMLLPCPNALFSDSEYSQYISDDVLVFQALLHLYNHNQDQHTNSVLSW